MFPELHFKVNMHYPHDCTGCKTIPLPTDWTAGINELNQFINSMN